MKKIFATLMALALALSLASCGETKPAETSSEAPVSSQKPVSSQAPVSSVAPPSIAPQEPSLNLAMNGTAFTNGNNSNSNGDHAINDGNVSTRWQAADREEGQAESKENPSWFGISWDEEQTFDTLFILWEQAHPDPDGFSIEISDDGETWTEIEFTAVRGGTPNENIEGGLATDGQTDDIILAEVVTTKNIRVVCFTAYVMPEGTASDVVGTTKTPTSVYEFEIYYSVDVEAAENETASEEAESTDETVAE